MLTYLLFRFGVSFVPRLPRGLLVFAANLVGALVYATNARARTAVLRNLAVVVPEAEGRARRRLAVRTFVNGALGYLDLFGLAHATAEELLHNYPIDGWEHLDAAFAHGQGVIMVTCHAGTPSAAGQIIALHGAKPTLVVEQLQPPAVHQLVARLRGAFGVHVITIGREGVREMISALRRNELVGIVSDRDVAGSGRELPFFGIPTRVTTAAASLALRTNAIVVPAFAARTGLLAGRGRIEPQVEMPRTGDTASDVREGTLRILARIEAFIREYPDQWAVFSDVWPATDGKIASSTIPRP
jgi:lauroyl/myristoyl acyltransferase